MASGAVPAVVVTIDALMTRTLPPQRLAALSVTLRPGDRVRILADGFPALENPVVAEGELA